MKVSYKCILGRILNRFTRDVVLMDTDLIMDVPDFLEVNKFIHRV